MGLKLNLWGQTPFYRVKRPPMGSKVTLWGSKVTLWGVKGHPMGSIGSKAVLWDPMGSKTVLWGQSSTYGVRAQSMGSEVTLWGVKGRPMGSKVTLWGSEATLWGLISPYGIYRIKRGSMGSKTVL